MTLHPDPALEPSYSTDWTQWAGAIIGACLVGLTGEPLLPQFVNPIFLGVNFSFQCLFSSKLFSGVLPLWVIPAKALGTARSAPTEDNLKYLLAFAGDQKLICVFLLLCCKAVSEVDIQSFFLSSWRFTWWRFPSSPPWNISTCKGGGQKKWIF